MNNYIILNGNISTNIQGLLIQSLPPVSKPMMRTEIEEIDGRDGDIVTKLGYSAYNKELVIGLYGDFDIDEVISYFNSEGTVIFSNEEDKYYNYQILEQIDFERLLRYRTATVQMHVQPFKYSAEDNEKVIIPTNNSISIRNSGNYFSKPTITIYGSGQIELSLNGVGVLNIDMGAYSSITISASQMEAYNGSTLLNRQVTGDYDKFKLNIGNNTITYTGNLTKIKIENYSRWI